MIHITEEDSNHIMDWYTIPLVLSLIHITFAMFYMLGLATYRITRRFA